MLCIYILQRFAIIQLHGLLSKIESIPASFSSIQSVAIEHVEFTLRNPVIATLYSQWWGQNSSSQMQNSICRYFLQWAFEKGMWKAWIGLSGRPIQLHSDESGGLIWDKRIDNFSLCSNGSHSVHCCAS